MGTTVPAGQAAILNAINDASTDIYNAARRIERLCADIAQSVRSGFYTNDGGLGDSVMKLVKAASRRHLLISELARPAGCIDGDVVLASTGGDNYWAIEPKVGK